MIRVRKLRKSGVFFFFLLCVSTLRRVENAQYWAELPPPPQKNPNPQKQFEQNQVLNHLVILL